MPGVRRLVPDELRPSLHAAAVGVMTTDAVAQLAPEHESAVEDVSTVPAAADAAAAAAERAVAAFPSAAAACLAVWQTEQVSGAPV